MTKVTIGMPVWNGAGFIVNAIESILAQTYDGFEVLISDNASSDTTAEICLEYAKRDPRISYVRQKMNIGPHANHTYVFRHSAGAYFKWAAHDDMLAPTFIEKCVAVLDSDEAVVNCAPDPLLIGEDGSPLRYSSRDKAMMDDYGHSWDIYPYSNAKLASTDVVERFAAAVLHTDTCFQIYGLIRRTALERTSILPGFVGADKLLVIQLSLLGRYHLLREPLLYRRYHFYQGGAKDRRVSADTFRRAAAYLHTVAAAELTPGQRTECYLIIARRIAAWLRERCTDVKSYERSTIPNGSSDLPQP
jgi:glycosyltransferase involved in cell wall biosynthesis